MGAVKFGMLRIPLSAEVPRMLADAEKRLTDAEEQLAHWEKIAREEERRKAEAEAVAEEEARKAAEEANDVEDIQNNRSSDTQLEDNMGNPIDSKGKLIVEEVEDINSITDEDFNNPTRNIALPEIPENVSNAIGTNGRRVIIKKNIFEKNLKHHKELTPEDSRNILKTALYSTDLYGQNKKATRPYNWILIHLADKNTCVLLEVDNSKDNCEVANWHYLGEEQLKQKEKQAE